ncbi:NifB/NifX family molybdenum-iron cluster-binding protein [Geobacter sp.]|uniref:NifB/NifX family molybdenum-iron cluster-binding protein n=1 Tax=Geobacter sp. TaxID=46610 RepID=UPI00262A1ED7|nr:NifB/NifX family molybdenum-iron cluster-binding protein [Geobacter sp.]
MRLCFPINDNAGTASTVYGHFASAPRFLVVDTRDDRCTAIPNCDRNHPLSGCNPFSALRGERLDAIIVDGIGDDALRAMNLCGFPVYRAGSVTVEKNVALFDSGSLIELTVQQSHLEGRCSSGESGCNCSDHCHPTEE